MRRLSYFVAASLDGYIARRDGAIDWLFHDADYGYSAFIASVDAVLMGRKTFEWMEASGSYHFGRRPAYVFSQTRTASVFPQARFVKDDPVEFARRLKREPGRTLWLVGGAGLAGPLLDAQEVDDLIVSIHPVTLGSGIPLFPPARSATRWNLRAAQSYPSGLVQLTYERRE